MKNSKIDKLKLLIEADAPAWYKDKRPIIWITDNEYDAWIAKQIPGTKIEKDVIDPETGEIFFEVGDIIPEPKKKKIEPFDTDDDDEEPVKHGLTDKEYWDMMDDFRGQAEEIEYDGMGTWEDAVGDIADSIIRFGHHGSGRFYKPEEIQSYLGYKKNDIHSQMGALGRLTDDIYDAGKRKQNNEDVAGPGVNAISDLSISYSLLKKKANEEYGDTFIKTKLTKMGYTDDEISSILFEYSPEEILELTKVELDKAAKRTNEDVAGPGVNAMGTAPTPTVSYKGKKFRLKKKGNKEMKKIEKLINLLEDSYDVMKGQAGNRILATIFYNNSKMTTHYASVEDFLKIKINTN